MLHKAGMEHIIDREVGIQMTLGNIYIMFILVNAVYHPDRNIKYFDVI